MRLTIPAATPEKLLGLMKWREVGVRELARAVGWRSHNSVNRIIYGRVTTIPEERARRIAEVLGVKVEDLFFDPAFGAIERNARGNRAERAA